MLGYAEEEIGNALEEWQSRIHPDDRERAYATLETYLAGETSVYELEHRLRLRNGTYRWILARGMALRDERGQPYRMAGSHTDITERKEAEERLRESEALYRALVNTSPDSILLTDLDGTVDLVISNPPYIPVGAYVDPEVSEYDPPAALWSGTDGLDAIRTVERTARRLLRPGGMVAIEHGAPQGAAVYWVFPEESGWRDTRNNKDLAGRDRFVTSAWSGEGA